MLLWASEAGRAAIAGRKTVPLPMRLSPLSFLEKSFKLDGGFIDACASTP
jgi:hypothetical protein